MPSCRPFDPLAWEEEEDRSGDRAAEHKEEQLVIDVIYYIQDMLLQLGVRIDSFLTASSKGRRYVCLELFVDVHGRFILY